MEYIHKAKAEKSRTKVLSDQMEAHHINNKAVRERRATCIAENDRGLRRGLQQVLYDHPPIWNQPSTK